MVGRVVRVVLVMVMAGFFATQFFDQPTRLPKGTPAPELHLRSYDGKIWNLERFKGRPVVLNFWGSWCPPCMAEIPSFVKAANDHPEVQFIGATVGSKREEVFSTIRRFRIPYAIAEVDQHGTDAWGAVTLPTTFFLNRDHQVVHSTRGQMTHAQLEKALLKLTSSADAVTPAK